MKNPESNIMLATVADERIHNTHEIFCDDKSGVLVVERKNIVRDVSTCDEIGEKLRRIEGYDPDAVKLLFLRALHSEIFPETRLTAVKVTECGKGRLITIAQQGGINEDVRLQRQGWEKLVESWDVNSLTQTKITNFEVKTGDKLAIANRGMMVGFNSLPTDPGDIESKIRFDLIGGKVVGFKYTGEPIAIKLRLAKEDRRTSLAEQLLLVGDAKTLTGGQWKITEENKTSMGIVDANEKILRKRGCIGLPRGGKVVFGREKINFPGFSVREYNPTVSKDHFTIFRSQDGKIIIIQDGNEEKPSTNGTVVEFTP